MYIIKYTYLYILRRYRYYMFNVNETYWFVIKGQKVDKLTIKGRVIEEDGFMVKVVTDREQEFIIIKSSIIEVNKDKGYVRGNEAGKEDEYRPR